MLRTSGLLYVVALALFLPVGSGLSASLDFSPSHRAAANQSAGASPDAEPSASAGADAAEVRPELTAELLYTVMVAEVADQRGHHRTSFTNFLRAAQLARHAGFAERAARTALTLGDAESIQRAIAAWLELAPESMAAHQIAAYVRLQAEDVDGAMEHLRRLIDLAAEEGEDGFMQAARLVHKLRPPERRLELMETLTEGDPGNADAWFARALVAAGADRHDDAADAARRAAELRPSWNEPRIFLVRVLMDEGKQAEARDALERFVAETPKDQGLRMLYAQMLVEEQEFSRARNVFEFMLQDTPKEPDVLFALGILSLQLEDLDASREYFARLRDTGERRNDAVYYLGQVEEIAENPGEAITLYERVEGEHALDAGVRVARLRARAGDVDAARQRLQQLRDRWVDEAVLLYMVEAEVLSDLDRMREAMSVYDEAVERYGDNADLLYARALHAARMGRIDILERDLRAILAKEPMHADALNALGYTLADQTNRYDEALSYIERALKLKPKDPAVLDSMGWIQYRLGRLEEAATYLRQALALLEDGEIAAHLGEVYWAMGKREEAWQVWEKALALDPDHEYLLRVIGRHRYSRSDTHP